MQKDVIYCKGCASQTEIPDDAIDLIISGPPYWEYIDYRSYLSQETFVWTKGSSYDDFLDKMNLWHRECYRVLRPGRYCVVNLGTVRKEGRCYPIPFDAMPILQSIGFEFCFEIIWHKISGGRQHAKVTVNHPYPGYYTPNNRTEYLLVMRKDPSTAFCSNKETQRSRRNRIPTDDLFKKEISNNVWHILPACFPLNGKHPCPFPPEIPYRLIRLFSLEGETVLDPFMGIGTTARAAKELGRHFIGYEVEQEFIDIALKDLDQPFIQRRPTICRFDGHEE